jgi:hypothetical protein
MFRTLTMRIPRLLYFRRLLKLSQRKTSSRMFIVDLFGTEFIYTDISLLRENIFYSLPVDQCDLENVISRMERSASKDVSLPIGAVEIDVFGPSLFPTTHPFHPTQTHSTSKVEMCLGIAAPKQFRTISTKQIRDGGLLLVRQGNMVFVYDTIWELIRVDLECWTTTLFYIPLARHPSAVLRVRYGNDGPLVVTGVFYKER